MTYCIGLLLNEGLVMMSDTRTNAGVDNFSSFPKMHKLAEGEDRIIYAATAGSLSTSQSALALLEEGLTPAEEGMMPRTLAAAPTMFRAAQLVGEAVQITSRQVNAALQGTGISGEVSILLGGRIGKGRPALFLIYSAGNFIECKKETPFFQIGENKYGKPILDRNISVETPLAEAVKIGFLSFDSAIRSNLAVARPIDIMIMPADPRQPVLTRRIEAEDDYFDGLSAEWGRLLHEVVHHIHTPPFMADLQPDPDVPQIRAA
jgi:putative proteasome-type protease